MRSVLHALNKQNQTLKKELDLYKKSYNDKVENIEGLNSQIKRLTNKVNFGIKSMFENKMKEAKMEASSGGIFGMLGGQG
mmetsp:Transcript_7987/g.7486  ORF Transcript_7987/g.7486 Transcript_7987/m.7486 type:complete len:80 (+) Transcript_7987:510-749(+)|eukprot:CAMPEP_0170551660 /NCGR_PEP_ID=MMETSP0211-20121228/9668_1 /TAXON_ID=311385 /ORGANISM="Pseudokeronopsis sp., Strain OXSARD2" /LENGTH=79 /DNA_ID=CAMNT_0010858977 /DNA_START=1060 /DNA_END=1299 /DNA_ORIENTATION=-